MPIGHLKQDAILFAFYLVLDGRGRSALISRSDAIVATTTHIIFFWRRDGIDEVLLSHVQLAVLAFSGVLHEGRP